LPGIISKLMGIAEWWRAQTCPGGIGGQFELS
jgi:hypothetical protein